MSGARLARQGVALGVRGALAYRGEVASRVASAVVVGALTWSVWSAVTADRAEVAGVSGPALVTYALVAWLVAGVYGTRLDARLAHGARTGDLVFDLLRPVPLLAWWYAQDLGRAGVGLALTGAPLLLLSLAVLPVQPPTEAAAWLWFALSVPLSHAVAFTLAAMVGAAAVVLRSGRGVMALKGSLLALFSGALVPLDVYPDVLGAAIRCSPLASLSDTPARLFLGQAGPELLAVQALWVVVLGLGAAWAWRAARSRLVPQGG